MEDISGYSDEQVGAAVRDVQQQSRQSLERYLKLQPVIDGVEGDLHENRRAGRGVGEADRQCSARAARLRAGCCGTRDGRPRRWICRRAACRVILLAPAEIEDRVVDEHRHRSRHHQLRARVHRSERSGGSRFSRRSDVLDVPQYVAQGRVEARRTLPSFLYLGDQEYVGVYAREQGALVPTKSVHSAKSWLSNPEVDRTAKILPWDAQEAGRVLSPVEVSAKILKHLADAWEKQNGIEARRTQRGADGAGEFRRRSSRADGAGGARGGNREVDAAGRTGGGVLFVDRERSGAIAEKFVRRADRAGVRRGRRHQRFHADSRVARERSRGFYAHGGGKASAARRRQSGSDAGVAGGGEAREDAFDPAAERIAAAVRVGEGAAALGPESEERRSHGAGRRDRHWWAER